MDVGGGKGQKTHWGTPRGNCGIRHAPASCRAACRETLSQGQEHEPFFNAEVMFTGETSAENKDWVETASFGKVQEFKLDTGA